MPVWLELCRKGSCVHQAFLNFKQLVNSWYPCSRWSWWRRTKQVILNKIIAHFRTRIRSYRFLTKADSWYSWHSNFSDEKQEDDEEILRRKTKKQLQTYLFRIYNICGNGGYPYSCEIYCGKTDDTSSSLGKRIVHNRLSLVQDAAIFEFFDNLYTSHSLITELSERHMRVCGTNRENRTNKCPLTESKVLKETK